MSGNANPNRSSGKGNFKGEGEDGSARLQGSPVKYVGCVEPEMMKPENQTKLRIVKYFLETVWILPLSVLLPYAALYLFASIPWLFGGQWNHGLRMVAFTGAGTIGLLALWITQLLRPWGMERRPGLRSACLVGLLAGIGLDLFLVAGLLAEFGSDNTRNWADLAVILAALAGPLMVGTRNAWWISIASGQKAVFGPERQCPPSAAGD